MSYPRKKKTKNKNGSEPFRNHLKPAIRLFIAVVYAALNKLTTWIDTDVHKYIHMYIRIENDN